jgi:hypothetical protein
MYAQLFSDQRYLLSEQRGRHTGSSKAEEEVVVDVANQKFCSRTKKALWFIQAAAIQR